MSASKSEKASNASANPAPAQRDPTAANAEISEQELETVAGGTWISPETPARLADLIDQATRPPDPAP